MTFFFSSFLDMPGERFIVTQRLLEYGVYVVRINVSMFQRDRFNSSLDVYLHGTLATLQGYFLIRACEIQAKIFGGNGKAQAYYGNVI